MTLIEVLRETRAKIHAGSITLDEAAAEIGSNPKIGLTETGARDLLGRPVAEVEAEYRQIFDNARGQLEYWESRTEER